LLVCLLVFCFTYCVFQEIDKNKLDLHEPCLFFIYTYISLSRAITSHEAVILFFYFFIYKSKVFRSDHKRWKRSGELVSRQVYCLLMLWRLKIREKNTMSKIIPILIPLYIGFIKKKERWQCCFAGIFVMRFWNK
jgi:hypothetical protein